MAAWTASELKRRSGVSKILRLKTKQGPWGRGSVIQRRAHGGRWSWRRPCCWANGVTRTCQEDPHGTRWELWFLYTFDSVESKTGKNVKASSASKNHVTWWQLGKRVENVCRGHCRKIIPLTQHLRRDLILFKGLESTLVIDKCLSPSPE